MGAVRKILVYFLVIAVVAAAYLVIRGSEGVTARNVAIALPVALLFAGLIWLRWDLAPQVRENRRAGDRRRSDPDVG